jgi:XTP/dITP diphosphohydrolase
VTLPQATSAKTTVVVATSNRGKLRDFAGAAVAYGVEVAPLPGIENAVPPHENAPTFEANAAIKAEFYSRLAKNDLVIADDSGLCVDQLGDAPGVYSARFAAKMDGRTGNSTDAENNARLLREMHDVAEDKRIARFVCCIAVARNGRLQAMFRGEVPGVILTSERGTKGFGYDPLFLIPELNKTFAELDPEEKARFSHRGMAFQKFLTWLLAQQSRS